MSGTIRYAERQYNRNYEHSLRKKEGKPPIGSGISGKMMGENTLKTFRFPRLLLSISFTPIVASDSSLESRPDLIVFQRMPALICRNSYKDEYRFVLRGGPRNLKQLVYNRIYRSYDDFMEHAATNQYLTFIAKCFRVTPFIFELAKRNLDVEFDLPFDYEKYVELCGGETLFAEYNELADKIVRDADERREARKRK